MDGVMLLQQAEDAGLVVTMDGDQLRIRGPRSAEPTALRLLRHKQEVMEALGMGRETTVRTVRPDRRMSLEDYLAVLHDPGTLAGPFLPPTPPFRQPPERGPAWAAWWAAVERQREHGVIGVPRGSAERN